MKLTTTDLANLNNQTSAVNTINANFALVETAIENTLSRDGTSPNTMAADLDMNGHQILNLPAAVDNTDPIRLGELAGLVEDQIALVATGPTGPQGPAGTDGTDGVGIPVGGTTGQVLAKASNTDYDTEWVTSGGSGLTQPTLATFSTWVNQGTATATDGSDALIISDTRGSVNLRGRVKAVPVGTSWSAICKFRKQFIWKDFFGGGIVLRESGTGKLIAFGPEDAAGKLTVNKWTDPTTFSAAYISLPFFSEEGYLKIRFDNTNYYFDWSPDGVAYTGITSAAKADFFTTAADQIGFFINPQAVSGSETVAMHITHYEEA